MRLLLTEDGHLLSGRKRDTSRAMSRDNVEVCERAHEALGIQRDVEAGLEYVHPDIVLESAIIGGAEANTYRGHDGVREWMAESDAAFEGLRVVADEFRELGNQVLMLGRVYGRGRESGVEVESPIAWLNTLRDGKIVRARGYLDWAAAIEAAAEAD
jgi:uncharacterized protein